MDTSFPWEHYAACADSDPELWFPEISGTGGASAAALAAKEQQTRQAKAVCFRCPVRLQCLEMAMKTETGMWGRTGIRGGLGPEERVRIVKNQMERERRARSRQSESGAA